MENCLYKSIDKRRKADFLITNYKYQRMIHEIHVHVQIFTKLKSSQLEFHNIINASDCSHLE